MSSSDLERLARARYGAEWELLLAVELGVTQRSVQRWVRGEVAITARNERHLKVMFASPYGGRKAG